MGACNTYHRLRVMPERRLSSQDTALLVKRQRPIHAREIQGWTRGMVARAEGGLLWMSEANVLSARKELKEPVNFHTVEKRHARAC